MIRYALSCTSGHAFDAWFASGTAFEGLRGDGKVQCPVCDSPDVSKALMAPTVAAARRPAEARSDTMAFSEPAPKPAGPLAPGTPQEAALAAFRLRVEKQSDYVGTDFAAEARRIHLGDAPERQIHGEARAEDARALIEDGIPVLPLPFKPSRRTN